MSNSKRKCGGCSEYFRPQQEFPGPVAWCSDTCALIVARKRMPAVRAKLQKEQKAKIRKEREQFNRRDISWQHKRCQTVFNRLRVLQELKWFADRDMEPECISCGNPLGNDMWSCGHFKTAGAQPCLRYDPMNTYLQHNVRCNQGLSGDIAGTKTTRGYRQGLIDRFGPKRAQEIFDYCESRTETVKWDWQEMEAWRKEWSAQIRQLERELERAAA